MLSAAGCLTPDTAGRPYPSRAFQSAPRESSLPARELVIIYGSINSGRMMMLVGTLANIHLAGFCAFALCGCTRNNQLMIRPVDGMLTYCSPLDYVPGQDSTNTRCIEGLETLGFTKAENVSLAGGGGIYLADDGHVLSSGELTALSPDIPPHNRSFRRRPVDSDQETQLSLSTE